MQCIVFILVLLGEEWNAKFRLECEATPSHIVREFSAERDGWKTWDQAGEGLLHHGSRGDQYACDQYRQLLGEHGIRRSMSRVGNCYDNAMKRKFLE